MNFPLTDRSTDGQSGGKLSAPRLRFVNQEKRQFLLLLSDDVYRWIIRTLFLLVFVPVINAIQLVLDLISLENELKPSPLVLYFCNFMISTPVIFDGGSVPGGGVRIRTVGYLLRNFNGSAYLQERVWLDS